MWNEKKSLMLSKACVVLCMVLLLVLLFFAPWVMEQLTKTYLLAYHSNKILFLVTIYVGGGTAGILLYYFYRLLHNIGKNIVFTKKNVEYLRVISWCLIAGSVIGVLSGFYYFPWFIVALAAAFMALILRVIKNVFSQAVTIKEENDYTI